MKKNVLVLSFLILIISCSKDDETSSLITVSINEDYSSIENPYDRWKAYELKDYIIESKRTCECFPPNIYTAVIKNNSVVDVIYEIPESAKYNRSDNEIFSYTKSNAITIDKAFQLIEEFKFSAHMIDVDYDLKFGFPTKLYIDIDTLIADEEIIWRFKDLQKLKQ